ncbi:peptidase M50-like protein [Motilibacter peucedani]|uniref:Peptidase M50-like protein n=1 Tax=Motilibacter peucedani TaxID=598650 RepID=A0A420XLB1_9ACTN|nr:site-2 protease family protein [Motilibacter peucedani]RKS69333.1 peptidase M50-like protein [Motilibacter peucedani]
MSTQDPPPASDLPLVQQPSALRGTVAVLTSFTVLSWVAQVLLELRRDAYATLTAVDDDPFAFVVRATHSSGTAGWVAAGVVTVGAAVSIAVHEAGHALVARRAGFQVTSVRIGGGPRVGTVRLAGVPVDLHVVPSSGQTVHEAAGMTRATRRSVLLAGPRANLLVAAGCAPLACLLPAVPGTVAAVLAVHELFAWAANMAVTAPRHGGVGSDGWQLRRLAAAVPRPDLPACDVPGQHDLDRASALLLAGDHDGAVAAFDVSLERLPLTHPARPWAAHARADALLTSAIARGGTPPSAATLAEAHAVVDAIAADPATGPALVHTRAMCHVLEGRPDEAAALLGPLKQQPMDPRNAAVVDATMAVALARLGRQAEARVWAEQVPSSCVLHAAAWRELTAYPAGPGPR